MQVVFFPRPHFSFHVRKQVVFACASNKVKKRLSGKNISGTSFFVKQSGGRKVIFL